MTPLMNKSQSSLGAFGPFHALPAGTWALGFVSMFLDISSELIHSLLPVFMATFLGASRSSSSENR
jgi:hypothetical protein